MENLNAEQIVKALECCKTTTPEDCIECPYRNKGHSLYVGCVNTLVEDALSLIKELTQAHEMLSESYDHLEKTKDDLLAERSRLTEENERLEKLSEDFGRDVDVKLKYILELEDKYDKELDKLKAEKADVTYFKDQLIADTVSELQTRFAMHYGTYTDKDMTPITEVFRLIDEIAKEMLEGEKHEI